MYTYLHVFYFLFFTFFQDSECKLLIMCKVEMFISDSLLLPPFSNQVVKYFSVLKFTT